MYLAVGRTRPSDGTAPDRTPSAVRPAGRRRLTGTVVALGTVSLVTDISSEMVTAVLPLYLVLGLGLSPLQFGFLDGLYNGVTAFVRLAGGHAADRWQRHKLVAGSGYALSAVCKLGLLLAGGSTPALSAALAADRVGKGVRTAPRDALISLSCDERDLGRAFGVHRAMDTTGAMLGPLVAFAVLWATVDAYDAVFVVSFCFGLLGVLILVAFVPGRGAGPARPPGRAAATLRETLRLFRVPAFRRILLAATALGLVGVGDGFLYLVLQKRLALDVEYFPLLPLGSAAVYLLLAVPLGRAADRIGRRIPYLLGHVALLGVYVALFSPVAGWPLTILVLVLHGTFYAATDGVLMALGGPVVPSDRRAGGMALLQTGQSLGRLFASVGFGAVWTLWGMDNALVLAAAALGAVLVLACVLLPAAPTPAAPAPVTAPEPS
ncbi:MFS transporter [Streptomyces sp. Root63]|uniref:MFS transporter n=1 Tax=unclassified Streptomyces TaxID=2593676 RepID=UPI0006FFBA1B|nr:MULTISPECIES: MFS transporter [unclassified Streptomyces]KQX30526.1 MFS transporter [Streptomyces sp. Root1295]KRA40459.1 MFS transporter [Streptomyces sp. Root63]